MQRSVLTLTPQTAYFLKSPDMSSRFILPPLFLLILTALLLAACSSSSPPVRLPFPFMSAAQTVTDETAKVPHSMPRYELPTARVRAPEFPRDFAWVNTDRPLYMQDELRGRVVVLDFWTYCCINCMHILPDLEYIEQKYANDPVVVIGVHSAKFDNESDRQNILTACQRYNIAHPVVVDEQHRIWTEYGVRAWPTLAVIDAEGRVVGQLSGEGNREVLDGVIASLLEEGREKRVLASGPPAYRRDSRVPAASGLAFPGKVHAAGEFVFIADSNHDRIVIADTTGKVMAIAGSGKEGNSDGAFAAAEFNNPQGMAYDEASHLLFVADTDNHLIRKLDLLSKTVSTISGTGVQVYDRMGGGLGTAQGLNSPWDLVLDGMTLYIAMAGPHQIWTLDLPSGLARAWVGSGREDIVDGTGTRSAALAQPSGLALAGEWLYFADSEVSAIRRANVKSTDVETLVGSGLFEFGDQSGPFSRTLLQHPLGVAVHGEDILVADTYNHKVKRLSIANKTSSDLIGTGYPDLIGETSGALSLYEPGGLSINGDLLYIADTNHDRIVRVNLHNNSWSEFTLTGLMAMQGATQKLDVESTATARFKPGQDLTLALSAALPSGVHLNRDAPLRYSVNGADLLHEGLAPKSEFPVRVTIPAGNLNAGEISALLSLAYCTDENMGLCVPVSIGWKVKLTEDPTAPPITELTAAVPDLK